ncbi:hypothetical protein BGW36DRAFT_138021 [Talaromyces proteolyticus]|uniref:Spc7 kinetochore protein domain-containing protein n=1 Tax=Talaromyces proteolyticus TaxID=1131652 RepID=A0AAD4Q304_9EURO|nr:uncharacterized protein BGW36DRAFT_138021 [Talaromyces proteolyticus]KAH8700898.1 hypothetical protein BGW36DRAFT_138021 [Talaromyces proteolyticus]
MASRDTAGASVRPRSRRSIAYVPKRNAALDKENATADIDAMKDATAAGRTVTRDKKSRSKSLGPGGLDALQISNGNRRKSSMAIPLKSILKPTVPLSPPRQIPAFDGARKRNASRSPSPRKSRNTPKSPQAEEGLLIDFSTPAKAPVTGTEQLDNPFDGFNAGSAIRDAKEREEKERRERERKAILEQREARRKSMGNRRVSFAPEATLHTWNVVELGEDSTASSSSNSTRRASSLANSTSQAPADTPELPADEEFDEDPDVSFSPIQHGLQEQPREFSSSPFSGSSMGGSDGTRSPIKDVDDAESDSDNDFDGESTAMSLDDVTARTSGSNQTDDSNTSSSARLNEALRQAAREAGTRDIDFHEPGDTLAGNQEIAGAFKPWIQKGQRISFDVEDMSALQDQENINPLQDANTKSSDDDDGADDVDNENEDLSMEITGAVGRILGGAANGQNLNRRKSIAEQSNYDEQTMDLTNVVGGIEATKSPAKSDADSNMNEDEEMTMELTNVVGGVLSKKPSSTEQLNQDLLSVTPQHEELTGRDFSEWGDGDEEDEDDAAMDFTGAVGRILSPIEESTESQDGHTEGMDFTTAMGRILPPGLETNTKEQAKQLMELETDSGQLASSPFQDNVPLSPPKALNPQDVAAVVSEIESPTLARVRVQRTRRESASSATRLSPPRQTTPTKPRTPSKQLTPQPPRPTTPEKTPPSSNITFRSASPKKLFREEIRASANKSQSPGRRSLFENSAGGESAPAFILRPHPRYSSGLGIDKEGLGSPKVAAILDRRRSIGEDAEDFVPQDQSPKRLRFEDPVKIHEEVDREREEEEHREEGHNLSLQASDLDPTLSLRDLISSLTPKKRKVGNRKSLHVGAAKGLLGKRPLELDEDEEEETPKRIRAISASPVKPVKLPAPPSKDETVRRSKRSSGKLFDLSPEKHGSFTPRGQPPVVFKSPIKLKSPIKNVQFNTEPTEEEQENGEEGDEEAEGDLDWEPLQLQDFLNLTNIHFMELTTTKRRHTTVPGNDSTLNRSGSFHRGKKEFSFEDCVAAGFCTVPMLELYQHSCRELKSYISEGRQIIRSIETETFADNPPLFREYVTAPPDIRVVMDNQFRNIKTHARLLSKAMWYEWRMKLLEGLKEGLDRHVEEMKDDDNALAQQENVLNSVVPDLVSKHTSLDSEASKLRELINEMENCDPDELRTARERLAKVDAEITTKKQQLQAMQEDLQDKVDTIEAGTELKSEFLEQIREAERVREECRGWSVKEVSALKDSVDLLQSQTGWSVVLAADAPELAGPVLTLSYKEELQVKLHPKLFTVPDTAMQVDSLQAVELSYVPQRPGSPKFVAPTITPTKALILSCLQKRIASIPPSSISLKQLFGFMSDGWNLTQKLEEEIRVLNFQGVTKTMLVEKPDAEPTLRARCILVGSIGAGEEQKRARVDVDFHITPRLSQHKDDGANETQKLEVGTDIALTKVYGFGNNHTKGLSDTQMREVILYHLGVSSKGKKVSPELKQPQPTVGQGLWSKSVQALASKLFS